MLAAAALLILGLVPQSPPNRVEFEVASLKPSNPEGGGMIGCLTYPGGRVVIGHATLAMLIEWAFDVQPFQVSGGPGWMREDRYDIEAKPPADSKSSKANPSSPKAPLNEEQRQMLQALLEARFQLKFHRESKEGPVYVLTMGSKNLKLKEAKDKGDFSWVGSPQNGNIRDDGMAGLNVSMPFLATSLSWYLKRPVLDQTGLAGFYDFTFEYASNDPEPDIASCILAYVQGIGLKLKSAKGPVEAIIVDQAFKPSKN